MGRYTKKKTTKKAGKLEVFGFTVILVGGLILAALEYAFYIFLVLSGMAIVAGIVYSIYSAINKKIQTRREEEENRIKEEQRINNLLNGAEPQPELISVSRSSVYSNKEDERINLAFRRYIDQKNEIKQAKAHLDYLVDKADALRKVHREDEADALSEDIKNARKNFSECSAINHKRYISQTISTMTKNKEITNIFTGFVSKLNTTQVDILSDFLDTTFYKLIRFPDGTFVCFTPCYILRYKNTYTNITTHCYEEVDVISEIWTEERTGSYQYGDEISSIRYLYEKKDGTRDWRYKDNPSTVYVYRGKVSITCGNSTCRFDFNNKSDALDFEKSCKNLIDINTHGSNKNNLKMLMNTEFDENYI